VAARTKTSKARRTAKRGATAAAGPKTAAGGEIWHITSDGRRETIVASAASVTAMDEAVNLYGDALRRLAKR
jgi:hypothetical protein